MRLGSKEGGPSQRRPKRKNSWFEIINESKATRRKDESVNGRKGVKGDGYGYDKILVNLVDPKDKD